MQAISHGRRFATAASAAVRAEAAEGGEAALVNKHPIMTPNQHAKVTPQRGGFFGGWAAGEHNFSGDPGAALSRSAGPPVGL